MKKKWFVAVWLLVNSLSCDISSHEEGHDAYIRIRAEEKPGGGFGCDTPPYTKGHACNPVLTQAKVDQLILIYEKLCDYSHVPSIAEAIEQTEMRFREDGFHHSICDE